MANASRPRKSSALKTSSRGLSPKGTVPVSAGIRNRANAQLNKSPKVDPLELYVTLVAGAENLSVNAARALLRLRRAQLAARDGARGALLRMETGKNGLDLIASVAKSQLFEDFRSLILLELLDSFPQNTHFLRLFLQGGELGNNDLEFIARGGDGGSIWPGIRGNIGWYPDRTIDWVSAKPVLESIAQGLLRHRKSKLPRSEHCPICGALAYAWQTGERLCNHCETRWPGERATLPSIGSNLEPFDARPLVALVRELEIPVPMAH